MAERFVTPTAAGDPLTLSETASRDTWRVPRASCVASTPKYSQAMLLAAFFAITFSFYAKDAAAADPNTFSCGFGQSFDVLLAVPSGQRQFDPCERLHLRRFSGSNLPTNDVLSFGWTSLSFDPYNTALEACQRSNDRFALNAEVSGCYVVNTGEPDPGAFHPEMFNVVPIPTYNRPFIRFISVDNFGSRNVDVIQFTWFNAETCEPDETRDLTNGNCLPPPPPPPEDDKDLGGGNPDGSLAPPSQPTLDLRPRVGGGTCNMAGNPCNPVNGNKYQVETDYSTDGTKISFIRAYNSKFGQNVGLGFGWTSSLHANLELATDGSNGVILRRPDGRGEPFGKNAAGEWHGDADTKFVLTEDATGFTLSNRNGSSERYDTTGKRLSETDANGQTTSYSYDANGRVATVTGPFGHVLTFAYTAAGNVSSVTDPTGAVYAYSYDANNNLIRVTYPDASAKLYHYENASFPHHLTGISYDDGAGAVTRFSTYAYDATGKAVLTEHAITDNAAPQERFTLAYDTDTQTTVTDPVGVQERLTFATQLGQKNLTTKLNLADNQALTQTFDAQNNLTCTQDEAGRVTTYTYNTTNQRLSMTEGQIGDCTAAVATVATRTTSYQYLSPTLSLPTAITTPSVAPGQVKTTTMTYADPAHPTLPTQINQSGFTPAGLAVSRTIAMSYNVAGQVSSIDGPRSDVSDATTLVYNECSTGAGCGQLTSITNALGQNTTLNSYDANGRLTQMTDPNGTTIGFSYDPRGRVIGITVTPPVGQGSARLIQSSYDHVGQLTQTILPDGVTLNYTYDAAQYLRSITDNLGNRVDYGYDLKGNRIREQTLDPDGTLVRSLETAYDIRNRVAQINTAGSLTQQLHDAVGNLVQMTDPNQSVAASPLTTAHDYDALNRLLQTVDNLSGVTNYSYDVNDRLAQVTAPNSATTQFVYDDLGNLLSETSPDRGVSTYTHDEAGNVKTLTDARGVTVTYTYDSLNRLTLSDYPGAAEDTAYVYDSGITCAFGIGRLCQISDESGTTQYAYDAFGNIAEQRKTELGVTYTTGYSYDAGDRITAMTYPDGRTVTYTRDVIGRIRAVTTLVNGIARDVVANRAYRADGLVTAQTFGNALSETRTYDLQGRLTAQSLGSLDVRTYSYDANGNRLTLTRQGTLAQATDYDALDRLTQETQPVGGYTLTYDANGNRTAVALGPISAALDYAPNTNRLVNLSGTDPRTGINLSASLNYDAAGNLTTLAGLGLLSYNNAGRLSRIKVGFLTLARYTYNFQGQRTQKTTPLGRTIYHHDLQGNLIAETTVTGQALKAYVWAEDQPVAQIAATGTPVYLHTDHLNTPRLATNSTGTVIWSWNSDAFGAIPPDSDPDGDGHRTHINLRFPGQYFDAETGFFYNWNRYYDPRLGRYITSDPIGLAGGLNSYLYAKVNPLKFTDPLGLNPLDPIERHILSHASRGNWAEVDHTIRTLTNLGEKEFAKLARQCASKRGGELVKQFKQTGVGQGARSGQHGIPYSRAGAELKREANIVQDTVFRDALKTQAERLIQQGRGISH